jgi:hypothetical protein
MAVTFRLAKKFFRFCQTSAAKRFSLAKARIRPDTFLSEVLGRKLTRVEQHDVFCVAKQISTITAHELREYLMQWEE